MSQLDQAIEDNAVVMLSKTWCPFCQRAKGVLAKYNLNSYQVLECDNEPALQQRAQALTGQRTVPNIFIGGKSIGGCDDLVALDSAGKLEGMLQNAGAM